MSKGIFVTEYWGELFRDSQSVTLFGFENISPTNKGRAAYSFQEPGSFWGFVKRGVATIRSETVCWVVNAGQWFCLFNENVTQLQLTEQAQLFVVHDRAHIGLISMGGPVEKMGRLQYIDHCTDTILYAPPVFGDPCLNLLHFPTEINQTAHYHPSSRSGIVYNGKGVCVSNEGNQSLEPGTIFYIPGGMQHKFTTDKTDSMTVISFHPDSDWGPTHDTHPMINRTWFHAK
jgi:mannose-6-phosphate isomerase-like protein (cupin superfamily)